MKNLSIYEFAHAAFELSGERVNGDNGKTKINITSFDGDIEITAGNNSINIFAIGENERKVLAVLFRELADELDTKESI